MNLTFINYFGVKRTYNFKAVKRTSFDDVLNIRADVIFGELVNNETFVKEAEETRAKLLKNPDKLPNLSLKYSGLIKK